MIGVNIVIDMMNRLDHCLDIQFVMSLVLHSFCCHQSETHFLLKYSYADTYELLRIRTTCLRNSFISCINQFSIVVFH